MLLMANVKAGFKTHTNFNQKAIKSIVLRDDVLLLNYMTRRGNEEDLCFNDIADADLFLYNTLSGYRSGQFSVSLLENFLESTSNRLKTYIPTENTGYGKLKYLTYGRFIITQEVETISSLNRSASSKECREKPKACHKNHYIEFLKVAHEVAIKQVLMDKNMNAILVYRANKGKTEHILRVSLNGNLNFRELKLFCDCLPKIDINNLTLKEMQTFGAIIYEYAKTLNESKIKDIANSWERK